MKKFIFILLSAVTFLSYCMNQKKAVIFGVTGQDGIYLSELLLRKGYAVYGVTRSSSANCSKLHEYLLKVSSYGDSFFLNYGDITNLTDIKAIIHQVAPDEIYNLAAQSHVMVSFDKPGYTAEANALGVLKILEAIKECDASKKIRFYQASSSEMFGAAHQVPQKEIELFHPMSPYAVAKLYGYWITVNYREAYGMYACNGILFNHESPLRAKNFVTRKITHAAARIKHRFQDTLYLGNLNARRDWGYAKDYVEAMWLMLQQDKPNDYVIATGQTHTVRELVELAFQEVGIEIDWRGSGVDEVGCDRATGAILVKVNPQYFRPVEGGCPVGDSTRAYKDLGWKPNTSFGQLVKIMVREDLKKTACSDK